MKKFFLFLLSIVLSLNLMFSFSITSFADVPVSQKVVSHSGTWSSLDFLYNLFKDTPTVGNYYTIEDSTGIPNGNILAPSFFYTIDGVTFDSVVGFDLLTTLVNKVVGVVMSPTALDNLLNKLSSSNKDDTYNKYMRSSLYDSNDNFLGYCLNDISGCYYGPNLTDGINVPSQVNNNLYDIVNNYVSDDLGIDYFTFVPTNAQNVIDFYGSSGYFDSSRSDFLLNASEDSGFLYSVNYNKTNSTYNLNVTNIICYPDVDLYFTPETENTFDTFCSYFKLVNGQTFSYTDLSSKYTSGTASFTANVRKDSDDTLLYSVSKLNLENKTSTSQTNQNIVSFMATYAQNTYFFGKNAFTIFRNVAVKTRLDNQTYNPDVYTTTNYYNYDTNNDNSVSIDKDITGHAVTKNGDIYDLCNSDFYNYYDNGTVNTTYVTNNTTTITNNYYSENDPDPDPDPDPDDNNTLDAILAAILRFFNAIGDIIGTILAGLINMIDAVLESIAGIMEDLEGLTDFFSALVSWLPEPIPTVIGIGVSLCILCAIIGFIRG